MKGEMGQGGGYLFPTNFLPRFFGGLAFLYLLIIHLRKKLAWGFESFDRTLKGYPSKPYVKHALTQEMRRENIRGPAGGVQGRSPAYKAFMNFHGKLRSLTACCHGPWKYSRPLTSLNLGSRLMDLVQFFSKIRRSLGT